MGWLVMLVVLAATPPASSFASLMPERADLYWMGYYL